MFNIAPLTHIVHQLPLQTVKRAARIYWEWLGVRFEPEEFERFFISPYTTKSHPIFDWLFVFLPSPVPLPHSLPEPASPRKPPTAIPIKINRDLPRLT